MNGKDPEMLDRMADGIPPEPDSPRVAIWDAIIGMDDFMARIRQAVASHDWQFQIRRIELQAHVQLLLSSFAAWADAEADADYERFKAKEAQAR